MSQLISCSSLKHLKACLDAILMLCFSFRSNLKGGMSTTVYEGQCAVIKYVNRESIISFCVLLMTRLCIKRLKSILLTEHFPMAIMIFGSRLGPTTAK